MRSMTCQEAEELLGAYALGALPEEERERVEAHLLSCAEHRRAADELTRLVSLLALTVEERAPPPELRDRIFQAVGEGKSKPRIVPLGTQSRSAGPMGGRRAFPAWRPQPATLGLAAAALLALAAGIGLGHYAIQPAAGPHLATLNFAGNQLAPNSRARLDYIQAQQRGLFEVTGLPALTPGSVYEIWLFKGGSPVDAGVSDASGGRLAAALNKDLTQYSDIAISIEPGEQQRPTSDLLLTGPLKGI